MEERVNKVRGVARDLFMLAKRIARENDREKRMELLKHARRIAESVGAAGTILRSGND
jgi:hypothetical protein